MAPSTVAFGIITWLAKLWPHRPGVRVWTAGGRFLVETAERDGIAYGRLVTPSGRTAGPEVPIIRIVARMPFTSFRPYCGDATLLMRAVHAAAVAERWRRRWRKRAAQWERQADNEHDR
jgi:hypothetical protein